MKKSINDIEVHEPEVLTLNSKTMNTPQVDISTLSAADLKAELQRREQAEKAHKQKAQKEYINRKDVFVSAIAKRFICLRDELLELKEFTIDEGIDINQLMYEVKGKQPEEQKSFTIENEVGDLKIEIQKQERFKFTEEAIVHINAIKELFKKKFEGRNKGFYSLLDSILMKSSKGDYDPKLLAKARVQVNKLDDPELSNEFAELENCQRVVGSATYCRAYQKDEKGKYQNINIQFSSL